MGGSNASTVQSSTSAPVRIHENNGEVHFHDDKNQLKVAVPVDKYFLNWEELRDNPDIGPIVFKDAKHNAQITLEWVEEGDVLDVKMSMEIYTPKFGEGYKALEKLVKP